MQLEEINKKMQQLYQITARHGISRTYVIGFVARGESKDISDIDFLIEMALVSESRSWQLPALHKFIPCYL